MNIDEESGSFRADFFLLDDMFKLSDYFDHGLTINKCQKNVKEKNLRRAPGGVSLKGPPKGITKTQLPG